MAQINTRIILRNDSSFNWAANENVVLLKGEVGIEFLSDESCKVKIGDGVKAWKDLEYFGGEQLFGDDKTIVINDEVDNAADRIMAIIRAEHAKCSRSLDGYLKLMEETNND